MLKIIHKGLECFLQRENDKDIWFWGQSNDKPYFCYINYNNKIHKISIEKENECLVNDIWKLFGIIDLVNLFGRFDTLIFHSSFVSYNDKAILFTGPSGIGKSTQADLWKKYENIDIVNGDRSAINKINDKWYAYGFPYSGSSDYCLNKKCEIRLIVVLEQGDKNKIVKLSGVEKFKYIYGQTAFNKWDKELNIKIIDLVQELIDDVEIVKLSCTPTQEAVQVLKKFIEEENLI